MYHYIIRYYKQIIKHDVLIKSLVSSAATKPCIQNAAHNMYTHWVIQNYCGQVWQLCTKIYMATVWVG
jgi:hypothetical protein